MKNKIMFALLLIGMNHTLNGMQILAKRVDEAGGSGDLKNPCCIACCPLATSQANYMKTICAASSREIF